MGLATRSIKIATVRANWIRLVGYTSLPKWQFRSSCTGDGVGWSCPHLASEIVSLPVIFKGT